MKGKEGGLAQPPMGPRYTGSARFKNDRTAWQREVWSLVVEYIEMPDASLSHRVSISIPAKHAPQQLLSRGSQFELMEGDRVIATGIVE
jgi:hypothetical protein